MKVEIYVYRQEKFNKEDKLINKYHLLKTDEYINNHHNEIIQKKNINTFVFTNQKLADANFTEFHGKLSDFNLKSDEIEEFDGIFETLFICITDDAVYYNMYVAVSTPLGMVHKKVKLNPIVLDEHTIQF